MSEELQQPAEQQATEQPGADPQLGEAGEKALRAEREARKALERELKLAKQQLTPEARQAMEDRLRAAEETALRAQEDAEKKAASIRSKYETQLQQTAAELEAAKREFVQYRLRGETERVFQVAEGLDGVSGDGRTFFDMFYSLKGDAFRYDDNNKLIVVDADGEVLRDPETRLPVTPVDYVKGLQSDPVYGYLFKCQYGSGSGARGSRDGRAVPGQVLSVKNTPKSDLFAAGFGGR
jgi:hypothetical protein